VVAITLTLVAEGARVDEAPIHAELTVDESKTGTAIDANLYGQFIEHLGRVIYDGIWVGNKTVIPNVRGYRLDILEPLRRLRVPVIRWPGGCFADQYNWRDGIGPPSKRPVRENFWGGVLETNQFGTHEFLDFAELIGADPYVSGNVGSMSPLEMAQWYEYMTSDTRATLANERRQNGRIKPWRVKYFGIGNELWGCGGEMRAAEVASVTRRYANFLDERFPNQSEVIRIASGPTANLADYASFTKTFLENARAIDGGFDFQALSLHYYTWPIAVGRSVPIIDDAGQPVGVALTVATGFGEDKWIAYLHAANALERVLAKLSAMMNVYDPKKTIALNLDEWGTWHKSQNSDGLLTQQNTLLDAEVAALTFVILHRHTERVKMANIAQLINAGQSLILTQGSRLLLTPTYYVYLMFQPFRDAMPLSSDISAPPYRFGRWTVPAVSVSVARNKDGQIYVALVNADPKREADVTTNLRGVAHGTVLTGATMDSHNTFENPDAVRANTYVGAVGRTDRLELRLPSKSVVVVRIDK
jgi:alpha-N-arabinofuranosidase